MFRLIIFSLLVFQFCFGFAFAKVPQTGQITCYDGVNNVIPCSGTGQDGDYQAGIVRALTRDNVTNIVTDNSTCLQWADFDNDLTYNWNEAENYCKSLNIGGNNWRMPTIEELRTIINYDNGTFPYVFNKFLSFNNNATYWSSRSYAKDRSKAWALILGLGHQTQLDKTSQAKVRCVSGTGFLRHMFARDNKTGIVTDYANKLMWQDNETITASMHDAIKYCESLQLGGYTDWRLPNFLELYTLADANLSDYALNSIFQSRGNKSQFWSSTIVSYNHSFGWDVNFLFPGDDWDFRSDEDSVRCVRTISDCYHSNYTLSFNPSHPLSYVMSPTRSKFTYGPAKIPVLDNNSANCKPISVGDLSDGKFTLTIRTPNFSEPMDVYLGILVPEISSEIYLFNHCNGFRPLSKGLVPWKKNITCGIDETLFYKIPLENLPPGHYYFVILIAPSGVSPISDYVMWITNFTN